MAAAITAAAGGGPGKRAASSRPASALLVVATAAFGLFQVSAVEVFTPAELLVENGTDAMLLCTFTSTEEITNLASVTWSFRPHGSTLQPATFFYYSDGKAYPGKNTQFKGRVTWSGDFSKKDSSIKVANMQPTDNGTYTCDVKNPPDIVVEPGQIQVKVVEVLTSGVTAAYESSTTPEKIARSGVTRTSVWLPVLQFCCILASFPSYLFWK